MIDTPRFCLKELQKQHATPQYLSWLRGDASHFLTNIQTDLTSLEEYIHKSLSDTNTLLLGIFVKKSNLHIGNIKFEFLDHDRKIVEMGILIGEPAFHGVGVAGEVIKAFSEYTIIKYGTNLMVLGVSKHNKNAISAYKKLGFKPESRPLSSINSKDGILMSWSMISE